MITYDCLYDYNLAKIVRRLLRDYSLNPATMTEEEIMNFIERHSAQLGELVAEDMVRYTSADDWKSQILEA